MSKEIKKIISIVMSFMLIFGTVAAAQTIVSADDQTICSMGDIIEFGSYPQSRIDEDSLIESLNNTESEWISYNYYGGTGLWDNGQMEPFDFMRYRDVIFNGNKYRAVIFDSYRPRNTGDSARQYNGPQNNNGYSAGEIYWFKFDPLKWIVLDPSTGFVMCDSIIDSQPYSNYVCYNSDGDDYRNESNFYASDWKTSSLRSWLNEDFYNTAFSENEKAHIFEYNDTKVFLLSHFDATNSNYGFNYNLTKKLKGSDYAKCQGLSVMEQMGGRYDGYSAWWLCSYYGRNSEEAGQVSYGGYTSSGIANNTDVGVCPVMNLQNMYSFAPSDSHYTVPDETRPTSIRDIIPTTEETTAATTTKSAADDDDSILAKLTTTTHNYGGVTTVWKDIGPAEPTGTDNVSSRVSIDGNTIYYVTFYANGYKIAKVPYVTSAKSIEEPPVPIIDGYVGRWESYELDGGDKSVNAIYMPASTAVYYVTFVADGETVSKVPFVYGMKEIKEPDVPEKRGYTGEWSDYSLIPCDITVNAVYTKKGNIFTNFFRSIIEFFRDLFDFGKIKIENPYIIGEHSTTAKYQPSDPNSRITRRNYQTTTTHRATTTLRALTTTTKNQDIIYSDPEIVLSLYNAARKATKPAPKGHQTMALVGNITADGAIGAFEGPLTSAANSALSKNSREIDWIPAANNADIKPEDVTYAKATIKDGVTTIELKFKDQTDGPNGNPYNGGPVARGIGTLGNIDRALNELGAEISEGKDTVSLTYTDAYLKVTIKDGRIIGGTWHYRVNIFVGEAKAKLSILSANLRNLNAVVDYKVVI